MEVAILAMVTLAVVGCSSAPPRYRATASLKSVVMGESKRTLGTAFGPRDRDAQGRPVKVEGMRTRATQRLPEGTLLEIDEVPLLDPSSGRVTYYWFLFQNERLAMWGRAEDWARVSGQYSIKFTPHADVGPPK